jgi:hypothetical protein
MSNSEHKDANNFPTPGGTAAGSERISSFLREPVRPLPDMSDQAAQDNVDALLNAYGLTMTHWEDLYK